MPSAADTRTRLLDAALYTYATHGFHRATTAQVARAAESSVGTLFRYFPTAEALLDAAQEHARRRLTDELSWNIPLDTLYAALRTYWDRLIRRAVERPDAFRYWALYWATPGPDPGPQRPGPGPRLPYWAKAGGLLARALDEHADVGALLAAGLEAQWTATVQFVLARPGWQWPDPRRDAALGRVFDGWWSSVGLNRTAPFPPPATAPA